MQHSRKVRVGITGLDHRYIGLDAATGADAARVREPVERAGVRYFSWESYNRLNDRSRLLTTRTPLIGCYYAANAPRR